VTPDGDIEQEDKGLVKEFDPARVEDVRIYIGRQAAPIGSLDDPERKSSRHPKRCMAR